MGVEVLKLEIFSFSFSSSHIMNTLPMEEKGEDQNEKIDMDLELKFLTNVRLFLGQI